MSWTPDLVITDMRRWPTAVRVVRGRTNETRRYVPERTATIVKVPRQSHVALGHYECGGCGTSIDAGDRYCRKCGTRLRGAEE